VNITGGRQALFAAAFKRKGILPHKGKRKKSAEAASQLSGSLLAQTHACSISTSLKP
jgi:hypothetical protein